MEQPVNVVLSLYKIKSVDKLHLKAAFGKAKNVKEFRYSLVCNHA